MSLAIFLASIISAPEQQDFDLEIFFSSYNLNVTPMTFLFSFFIKAAATEESTPPDIATTVGFLFFISDVVLCIIVIKFNWYV